MKRCLAFATAILCALVTVSSACLAQAPNVFQFTLQPDTDHSSKIRAEFQDHGRRNHDNQWSDDFNAAELIGKSNRERNAYQQWERQSSPLERIAPYGSPRMPIPDQVNGTGAEKVYQMLAKGNTALFLDVWPLHMFYRKFGLQRFQKCLT